MLLLGEFCPIRYSIKLKKVCERFTTEIIKIFKIYKTLT